jgi:adenylyltransferase/sulfurtransferase
MQDHIISPFELDQLLKKQSPLQLVDVRTIDKHIAGNIGGEHIPLHELAHRFAELDSNQLVVTYCTLGGKSMQALQFLLSVGFKNVKSLDGGITAFFKETLEPSKAE